MYLIRSNDVVTTVQNLEGFSEKTNGDVKCST